MAALLLASLAIALIASPAQAEIYGFEASIYEPGVNGPNRSVTVRISGLDRTKTTNLRVRRPGADAPVGVVDLPAGDDGIRTDELTELRPGDSIEVRQPLNGVEPVEVLSVPRGSVELEGSRVTGTAGPGQARWLEASSNCLQPRDRRVVPASGRYSFDLGAAATAGRTYTLTVREKPGFILRYQVRAAGERPCLSVETSTDPNLPPGTRLPLVRTIGVAGLDPAIPTTRVVVLRGDTKIVDRNLVTPGYGSATIEPQIGPGDRIEVYRPQTAATPSTTIVVPPVIARFDPEADLASVSGSALRGATITACKPRACEPSTRNLLDVPARGAKVDFGEPQGTSSRLDLAVGDSVWAEVRFAEVPLRYVFDAVPGDLAPPSIRIAARARVRIAALRKLLRGTIPIRISSSEPASGSLRLLSGRVTLAAGRVPVGTAAVIARLGLTRAGRKRLRGWLGPKGIRKPKTLRIEGSFSDRSGNESTETRSLLVVP